MQIGPYEVVAPLGAGGMGEVWRARDPRLQRDVAIKLLPEDVDRDAIARFRLEARAASALSHPHILTIYDVGENYIVMELVDGETLRERIARQNDVGAIVDLLIQIADGLSKAHEAGIVHRDLKPENIMITRSGYAKILDFGLARMTSEPIVVGDNDPTLAAPITARDMFVGTAAYASPEQAVGHSMDHRSDIFSFGCVAYEALTKKRAFAAATPIETLRQIVAAEPPSLRSINANIPSELQRIINRCMAKSPDRRYPTMDDVNADLRRFRERLRTPAARTLPRAIQLTFHKEIEQFPAISRDGRLLVFSREAGDVRKLFLMTIDEGDEQQITEGDHDDIQASWSPDGTSILFLRAREPHVRVEASDVFGRYRGGDIWRLDLETKRATLVVSDAANPSWSPDGKRIAFDAAWSGSHRIWIADDHGRNSRQVSADSSDAVHHVRPRWSPDGSRIVFQSLEGTKSDVRVVEVESQQITSVTDDYTMDLHPVWSPFGDAIYFSSYRSGGINVWRMPVGDDGTPAGAMEQITAGPGHDVDCDIADTGRLVFSILKQNADIWRLPVDPATGTATGDPEPVIATTRENSRGAWSPDGSAIAFSSDRGGAMNLWLRTSDGKTTQLTRGDGGDFQPNWSPDGRSLVFFSGRECGLNIWRFDLDTSSLTQLTHDEGLSINPFFSPDGSRIAYQCDRDGRLEVWLMNADGSSPRPLTNVGVIGHFLRWSRDGRQIFFRCPNAPGARTMTVPANGGDAEPAAEVMGGAHMSLSPDESMIMDVVAHRTLWVSPLHGGEPRKVFAFDDPDSRIDYPVWSPDGRFILFDRFTPQGGDVWMVSS